VLLNFVALHSDIIEFSYNILLFICRNWKAPFCTNISHCDWNHTGLRSLKHIAPKFSKLSRKVDPDPLLTKLNLHALLFKMMLLSSAMSELSTGDCWCVFKHFAIHCRWVSAKLLHCVLILLHYITFFSNYFRHGHCFFIPLLILLGCLSVYAYMSMCMPRRRDSQSVCHRLLVSSSVLFSLSVRKLCINLGWLIWWRMV